MRNIRKQNKTPQWENVPMDTNYRRGMWEGEICMWNSMWTFKSAQIILFSNHATPSFPTSGSPWGSSPVSPASSAGAMPLLAAFQLLLGKVCGVEGAVPPSFSRIPLDLRPLPEALVWPDDPFFAVTRGTGGDSGSTDFSKGEIWTLGGDCGELRRATCASNISLSLSNFSWLVRREQYLSQCSSASLLFLSRAAFSSFTSVISSSTWASTRAPVKNHSMTLFTWHSTS